MRGIVSFIVLSEWLATATLVAQSQPPTPSAREPEGAQPNQQAQTRQQQPTTDVRGTDQSPLVVEVLPTEQTPEETARTKAERQDEASARWWTIGLTGVIALFTFGLIIVGALQWRTYQATLAASKAIERAYLRLTTKSPQLRIGDDTTGTISFDIQIKNHGRTPARILGGWVALGFSDHGHPPPDMPRNGVTLPSIFLVPDDTISQPLTIGGLGRDKVMRATQPLPVVGLGSSPQPPLELWLMGYVDYHCCPN